jgi:hypothetical protein
MKSPDLLWTRSRATAVPRRSVDGERISLLSYNSWAPSPAPLNYNVFRAPLVAFSGNANITLEVYAHLFARVAPRIPHAPRSTPASHAAIAGGND